jgi:type II secretory pathway pseudopilin PulG
MIRGTRPQQSGFTIVEVIIFLAVSIALVASAVALFSTRIPKTQFSQSLNELDIKLKSVGNDVLNGYYPSSGNISCSAAGNISSSPADQGTNASCVFLGRAIQFGDKSNCDISECDQFRIYTVYGLRQNGGNVVTSLDEAAPKITDLNVEAYTTGFGLHVTKVLGAGNGVAYLSTFGSRPANVVDAAPSGASQVELRPLTVNGGNFGLPEDLFGDNSPLAPGELGGANPAAGVRLCLKSGTSKQFAILTLGEAGRPLSNKTEVLSELAWSAQCS